MQSRFALDEPRTFVCLRAEALMLLIIPGDTIFHWRSGRPMLAAVFELARPLLYALDPEQAHELTLKSLEAGIYPRPAAPDDPQLERERVGPRLSQPARHRGGLRQGCARARCRARHGFRLRGDRHRDAAPAGGQSAPARVPADPGSRADQSAGLQQCGACGGAGAAAAAPACGRGRRQRRRQQGCGRPRGRLRGRHACVLRRGELFHHQRVLAQYAGPARSAGAGGARRTAGARAAGARGADGGRQDQGGRWWSSSRPTLPRTISSPSCRCSRRAASTASPCRTRRWRASGCAMRRSPRRRAASRGGRCSTARPSCWRACIC